MYMPTWPAANAWLIVPHSKRKLLPIELSSHRIALSSSSALTVPGLSIVASTSSPVPSCMRPPLAYVSAVSIQPPVLFCDSWAKPACPVASAICLAYSRTSSHVVGGASGSSPASSNSARL